LGSTVYEIEQVFTNYYFDFKDLISIWAALLIGLFIYQKIYGIKPTHTTKLKGN